MLYSQHFTFHWKLLVLVSRIQKSGTGDNNFGKWKATFPVRPTEMTRPVTVDHLQSWSWIFRSHQTEMVRSIWWTNRNFRSFRLNGKRPRAFLATNHAYQYATKASQECGQIVRKPRCTVYKLLLTTSPRIRLRARFCSPAMIRRLLLEGMCTRYQFLMEGIYNAHLLCQVVK